jgi:hypothetical protein
MDRTAEPQTAYLVLRAAALLPENHERRDRLLNDVGRQLGVGNEWDLVAITNIAAEGTGTAARFPTSQQALCDGISSSWESQMADLFVVPKPS